jgi:hypothetical protein
MYNYERDVNGPGEPFTICLHLFFEKPLDKRREVWYNIGVKEREVTTMAKFPMDKRVKVDSNKHYDFYIMHCDRVWYVEAFPIGTLDHEHKTMAGFSTLKVAKECVESWKGWMKPRGVIN